MHIDYDVSLLADENLIDMYIEPTFVRLDDDYLNLTRLNFTRKVLSFEDKLLKFKLDFIDPLYISTDLEYDQLIINIKHK